MPGVHPSSLLWTCSVCYSTQPWALVAGARDAWQFSQTEGVHQVSGDLYGWIKQDLLQIQKEGDGVAGHTRDLGTLSGPYLSIGQPCALEMTKGEGWTTLGALSFQPVPLHQQPWGKECCWDMHVSEVEKTVVLAL